MADFPFKALTIDCFGTLMDWRRGQMESLQGLSGLHALASSFPELDRARMEEEVRMQADSWRPYHQILADSLHHAAHKLLQVDLSRSACRSFSEAQADWPPFADSVDALKRLSAHCTLALLSNCDADVLQHAAKVGLGLDHPLLISSEAVRSYKPAAAHWEAVLRLLDCTAEEVLHVSAYTYYDLAPAHMLGFALAFVARDQEPVPKHLPLAYQAHDLADLADQLGC